MSRIRANQITNQSADGAPTVQHGLVISGVTTVTGSINNSNLTGITTISTLDLNGDLDVDGHTNLDNVSIAGVMTATTVNATSFVGSGAQLTGIVGGKFNGPAAGILTTSSVGIQTNDVTSANLVGAATSLVGLYIGDGSLIFSNNLSRSGGYYITTGVNALNAGPVTLNSAMTLDGTWVIV